MFPRYQMDSPLKSSSIYNSRRPTLPPSTVGDEVLCDRLIRVSCTKMVQSRHQKGNKMRKNLLILHLLKAARESHMERQQQLEIAIQSFQYPDDDENVNPPNDFVAVESESEDEYVEEFGDELVPIAAFDTSAEEDAEAADSEVVARSPSPSSSRSASPTGADRKRGAENASASEALSSKKTCP